MNIVLNQDGNYNNNQNANDGVVDPKDLNFGRWSVESQKPSQTGAFFWNAVNTMVVKLKVKRNAADLLKGAFEKFKLFHSPDTRDKIFERTVVYEAVMKEDPNEYVSEVGWFYLPTVSLHWQNIQAIFEHCLSAYRGYLEQRFKVLKEVEFSCAFFSFSGVVFADDIYKMARLLECYVRGIGGERDVRKALVVLQGLRKVQLKEEYKNEFEQLDQKLQPVYLELLKYMENSKEFDSAVVKVCRAFITEGSLKDQASGRSNFSHLVEFAIYSYGSKEGANLFKERVELFYRLPLDVQAQMLREGDGLKRLFAKKEKLFCQLPLEIQAQLLREGDEFKYLSGWNYLKPQLTTRYEYQDYYGGRIARIVLDLLRSSMALEPDYLEALGLIMDFEATRRELTQEERGKLDKFLNRTWDRKEKAIQELVEELKDLMHFEFHPDSTDLEVVNSILNRINNSYDFRTATKVAIVERIKNLCFSRKKTVPFFGVIDVYNRMVDSEKKTSVYRSNFNRAIYECKLLLTDVKPLKLEYLDIFTNTQLAELLKELKADLKSYSSKENLNLFVLLTESLSKRGDVSTTDEWMYAFIKNVFTGEDFKYEEHKKRREVFKELCYLFDKKSFDWPLGKETLRIEYSSYINFLPEAGQTYVNYKLGKRKPSTEAGWLELMKIEPKNGTMCFEYAQEFLKPGSDERKRYLRKAAELGITDANRVLLADKKKGDANEEFEFVLEKLKNREKGIDIEDLKQCKKFQTYGDFAEKFFEEINLQYKNIGTSIKFAFKLFDSPLEKISEKERIELFREAMSFYNHDRLFIGDMLNSVFFREKYLELLARVDEDGVDNLWALHSAYNKSSCASMKTFIEENVKNQEHREILYPLGLTHKDTTRDEFETVPLMKNSPGLSEMMAALTKTQMPDDQIRRVYTMLWRLFNTNPYSYQEGIDNKSSTDCEDLLNKGYSIVDELEKTNMLGGTSPFLKTVYGKYILLKGIIESEAEKYSIKLKTSKLHKIFLPGDLLNGSYLNENKVGEYIS